MRKDDFIWAISMIAAVFIAYILIEITVALGVIKTFVFIMSVFWLNTFIRLNEHEIERKKKRNMDTGRHIPGESEKTMEELTKKLLKLKNELDNSPYEFNHEADRQECTMFAYAAGYAPEMSVRDVYEIIDKIQRGVAI